MHLLGSLSGNWPPPPQETSGAALHLLPTLPRVVSAVPIHGLTDHHIRLCPFSPGQGCDTAGSLGPGHPDPHLRTWAPLPSSPSMVWGPLPSQPSSTVPHYPQCPIGPDPPPLLVLLGLALLPFLPSRAGPCSSQSPPELEADLLPTLQGLGPTPSSPSRAWAASHHSSPVPGPNALNAL